MTIFLSVVGLLIVAGVFFLMRTSSGKKASRGAAATAKLDPLKRLAADGYWGVRVEPGSCPECAGLKGETWELHLAPKLPLSNCTSMSCTCRYLGYPERRHQVRRNPEDRRQELRFEPGKEDRRSSNDRRKSENLWKNG